MRLIRLLLAAALATVAVALGLTQANATQEIVGGSRASIADFPYVVYLTTSDGFQFCGGTLVDDNKVITAAHCTVGKQPADIQVVATSRWSPAARTRRAAPARPARSARSG